MEKITLYNAVVEFEDQYIWQKKGSKMHWSIGLFGNEQDANLAIQLYEKAQEANNDKCTGVHYVTHDEYPKQQNIAYYKSLNEFINQKSIIAKYVASIGADELDKILKTSAVTPDSKDAKNKQDRQEFDRLIERMIRDYRYRIKIDKMTGTCQRLIEEEEKIIEFLEDLRDGKIELNK